MAEKCTLCGTVHEPYQAHRFAPREVNHQAVPAPSGELVRLRAENAELRHDLERYKEIANRECQRAEEAERRLVEAQKPRSDRREYMKKYMREKRARERVKA